MAKLTYTAIMSLDGEVHAFINDLERPVGTYLYGRRLYEVMLYWETADTGAGASPVERDFADIWQAAEKVVYSTTLEKVSSERTRIERTFDLDAVRQLKVDADREITVGGPELAGQALEAGLVDECQFFVVPFGVGVAPAAG